jgi:hypothetical protein
MEWPINLKQKQTVCGKKPVFTAMYCGAIQNYLTSLYAQYDLENFNGKRATSN